MMNDECGMMNERQCLIHHSSFRIHHFFHPFIAGTLIFKARTRKPQRSETSSICLDVGLPAPCPALVSMRIKMGAVPACAACMVAANLKLCPGQTRSSWSAVVIKVGG